jgi:hypothetical protein
MDDTRRSDPAQPFWLLLWRASHRLASRNWKGH